MIHQLSRVIAVCLMIGLSLSSQADKSVESLSSDLRQLLSKEMQALQGGMQALIPAYISGDYKEVASIAGKMESGFILKQKITPAQKKELMAKLPKAFIYLDKRFHGQAGMLKHVAEEQHQELISFYVYKMMDTCQSCHSQYAQDRFPKLKLKSKHHHHH